MASSNKLLTYCTHSSNGVRYCAICLRSIGNRLVLLYQNDRTIHTHQVEMIKCFQEFHFRHPTFAFVFFQVIRTVYIFQENITVANCLVKNCPNQTLPNWLDCSSYWPSQVLPIGFVLF